MDPLTHGMLGAATAQAVVGKYIPRRAWLVGLFSAMAPDLDVFIGALGDRSTQIAYHRHFTHALAFVPIGGLLCALPFLITRAGRTRWRPIVAAALIGYLTHGFLDTCTSYGTFWLWPFTNARFAWDCIAIIDPIFTAALLLGLVAAAFAGKTWPARAAVLFCALYLCVGVVQNQRVLRVQRQLAAARQQTWERGRAMPTLGNLVLWRSLYISDGRLHADAVRLLPWSAPEVVEGQSVAAVDHDAVMAAFGADPANRLLLERFFRFADGYVAPLHGEHSPEVLFADMRYSATTGGFAPLWGVATGADPGSPLRFVGLPRDLRGGLSGLWREVLGSPGP